eukprot:TRINITY_DN7533_c0_g1_i1.p1 TRINITY_DN7533_c0_g1~~TRINITY_DN7533_c0_g1_i1.p1  ORF type:complete len:1198 (+),score=193.27 TRINITY_DN7533_c0_g1_i1:672-4265(+)
MGEGGGGAKHNDLTNVLLYTEAQIREATNDFDESRRIGTGGFGEVYKGRLQGPVAIKRLLRVTDEEVFMKEIALLSKVRHSHVVGLLGYCPEAHCLVTELCVGGSLQEGLEQKGGWNLPWRDRIRLCQELGHALEYLHNEWKIVHRDLKPDNILLDRANSCKLVDFGIAQFFPDGQSKLFSRDMKCTQGYVGRTERTTGFFSYSSDGYALGLIMLQLLTGTPKVEQIHAVLTKCPGEGPHRTERAVDLFSRLLDPNAGRWNLEAAAEVIRLAVWCTEAEKKARPNLAADVLPALEKFEDEYLEDLEAPELDEKVKKDLLAATRLGDQAAIIALGDRYERGDGFPINIAEAARLYNLVTRQRYPEAEYRLGCWYALFAMDEEDGEQNAAKWYEAAAKRGYAQAHYELGLCYQYGWGVVRDLDAAKVHYNAAQMGGDERAAVQMESMQGTEVMRGLLEDLEELEEEEEGLPINRQHSEGSDSKMDALSSSGHDLVFSPGGNSNENNTPRSDTSVSSGNQDVRRRSWSSSRVMAPQTYSPREDDSGVHRVSLEERRALTPSGPQKKVSGPRWGKGAGKWYSGEVKPKTGPSNPSPALSSDGRQRSGTLPRERYLAMQGGPSEYRSSPLLSSPAQNTSSPSGSFRGFGFSPSTSFQGESAEEILAFRRAFEAKGPTLISPSGVDEDGRISVDDQEAFRIAERAAQGGSAEALVRLGRCFELGRGVKRDYEEAVRLYKFAVAQNNPLAQAYLATCYVNGTGVQMDYHEAVRLYRLAAVEGHSGAQIGLAECYRSGHGVEPDFINAALLYRLAAAQGDAMGEFELACCYQEGRGVQQDHVESARLYMLAAEKGNAPAQNCLGWSFYNGKGVTQDFAQAFHFFELAAMQGHADAQNNLGRCFFEGKGIQEDHKKAVALFTLAAQQGNVAAQSNLAKCYKEGKGVEKNSVAAVHWYQVAAAKGDMDPLNGLAECLQEGKGVKQDHVEAARLFKLAAEQGHVGAQNSLGLCYHKGRGVAQDLLEGARYFALAAQQGNADAQKNLGWCFQGGKGVPQDFTEAARLFALSAAKGNIDAQNNLAWCHHEGKGVKKDYAEAAHLFGLAAAQGSDVGQYNLGRCFQEGEGVRKDINEAARLYALAAAQGHASAQNYLGWCHQEGKGVKKDYEEATRLYGLAAEQGNESAKARLQALNTLLGTLRLFGKDTA